jgi:hypothetical protein
MNLSDAFTSIAIKQIAQVDIPKRGSNQHELNGTSELRKFFKTAERLKTQIQWHYFADGTEIVSDRGTLTFYDARQKSTERTGRSEWRGYYNGDFLSVASPGDVLLLAKTQDGALHGMLFEAESNWLRSVLFLLKLQEPSPLYQVIDKETLRENEIQLTEQLILDELGIVVPIKAQLSDQELMIKSFGKRIPNTKTLAKFAREQVEVDPTDADAALVKWIERESSLFYALERVLVQERIDRGFDSVEDFLEYSISIQQSRRSRMGLSLQHHLSGLFEANGLRFTAQARTERKKRPDFLFPGETEYQNPEFNSDLLVMLGAKSTLKERWSQILLEADRIREKHLCTLEPAISKDQTEEIRSNDIWLVIPSAIQATYAPQQRAYIWSLNEFLEFVQIKQRSSQQSLQQ